MVCDATAPDHPVVYVNPAFAQLSGYPVATLMGRTCACCRAPTGTRRGACACRGAAEGTAGRVLMRNYRPDGAQFWNEIVIQPVRSGKGELTHFIGYHRDASERLKSAERASLAACRRGCARTASRGCTRAPISRSCCSATGSSRSATRTRSG